MDDGRSDRIVGVEFLLAARRTTQYDVFSGLLRRHILLP